MTKQFTTIGYAYNELNEKAKEKVKEWYLNDPIRSELFPESIKNDLECDFPNSDLDVIYSLCYCQGDGLNIVGKVNLYDFIDFWEASEKQKRRIEKYIDYAFQYYTFEQSNHYCYSCKFIDKKYIDDAIDEFIEELKNQCFRNINTKDIKNFFNDLVDYFEALDSEYEKSGYNYLYNVDEDEIEESCLINEWYFDAVGNFLSC